MQYYELQIQTLKYYFHRAFVAQIGDLNLCIDLYHHLKESGNEQGDEFYQEQESILNEIENAMDFYFGRIGWVE